MAIFNSYVSLPEGMFANQNSIINIYIYTHIVYMNTHVPCLEKTKKNKEREREM